MSNRSSSFVQFKTPTKALKTRNSQYWKHNLSPTVDSLRPKIHRSETLEIYSNIDDQSPDIPIP